MTEAGLQWGGRFSQPPDTALLAFGSSLEDDLVLAPFDAACSMAHVSALRLGGVIDAAQAAQLLEALRTVENEIRSGAFVQTARENGAEDVHGAIDARVRALCLGGEGELLHAGRSRNDQVATTLALYARERAQRGGAQARAVAHLLLARARDELGARTVFAATTHWQPAQPVLLAFWLVAAALPFTRAVERFARAQESATQRSPLGAAAVAGSTLTLDSAAAAAQLGFAGTTRNAMDAIGTRDAAMAAAHAYALALVDASRICSELVVWCSPAFGYTRLGDASSTGSSLMPQKRNPDPFELVRATAAEVFSDYAGAVETLRGLPLSYHRDLQVTKRLCIRAIERGSAALDAFARALGDVRFNREAMRVRAGDGYTIATDVADALIRQGVSARRAHALVGARVALAEEQNRALNDGDLAALAAEAGVESLRVALFADVAPNAKRTRGSTHPDEVARAIEELERELS
jgi:argininosuccinate lyase